MSFAKFFFNSLCCRCSKEKKIQFQISSLTEVILPDSELYKQENYLNKNEKKLTLHQLQEYLNTMDQEDINDIFKTQ